MKKVWRVVFGLLLAWALASCALQGPSKPVDTAAERFAAVASAVLQGSADGDTSKLEAYLKEEDRDGVVQRVLAENGLRPGAEQFLWWSPPNVHLPDFAGGEFADGDVLVNRNTRSFTSNFIAWLYLGTYTHCGVLDKDMAQAQPGNPDAPCVITATLNTELSGVTYETWRDWNASTLVTRLRHTDMLTDLDAAKEKVINTYRCDADSEKGSEYAFVYYDPVLQLVPVSARAVFRGEDPQYWYLYLYGTRTEETDFPIVQYNSYVAAFQGKLYDEQRWYCSKTSYWIYQLMGLNIEDNTVADTRWSSVEATGWYKLYRVLLLAQGIADANNMAKAFGYYSGKVIVMPDEIFFADCWCDKHSWQ